MPNLVTNQLQLTVLSTEDSTNNVLVNRTAIPSLDEFVADFVAYGKATGPAFSLPFPEGFTLITKFYIRNLASIGGGSILVTWQLNGGVATEPIAVIGPGDILVYWQGSTGAAFVGATGQGINFVSVASSVVNVPYEYFLGA
jgi:hypothetical protein